MTDPSPSRKLPIGIALIVAILAGVGLYFAIRPSQRDSEPTPDHPFSFFKLTNNSGRVITSATVTARRLCKPAASLTTSTWSPAMPLPDKGTTDAVFSGWDHVRTVTLTVTFESGSPATASMPWNTSDLSRVCFQSIQASVSASSTITTLSAVEHTSQDAACTPP